MEVCGGRRLSAATKSSTVCPKPLALTRDLPGKIRWRPAFLQMQTDTDGGDRIASRGGHRPRLTPCPKLQPPPSSRETAICPMGRIRTHSVAPLMVVSGISVLAPLPAQWPEPMSHLPHDHARLEALPACSRSPADQDPPQEHRYITSLRDLDLVLATGWCELPRSHWHNTTATFSTHCERR